MDLNMILLPKKKKSENMRIFEKPLVLLAFIISTSLSPVIAQQDSTESGISNQTVTVITEYTPEINDASRLESLPEIQDTINIQPEFDYHIFSIPFRAEFNPVKLNAAELKPEPQQALDHGYAKLAIGNYLSLMGQVYYNTVRDDERSTGISLNHYSTHGNIKNASDQKIYSGYNSTALRAYGQRFFTKTTVSGDVAFESNTHYFYGYNPDLEIALLDIDALPRDKQEFIDLEMQQRFSIFSAKVGAKSRYETDRHMNYDINLDYNYWQDIHANTEHKIKMSAHLNKSIRRELVGAEALLYFLPASYLDPSHMLLDLSPYVAHSDKRFKLHLGLHTEGEFRADSVNYHFYPDVHIQHNIANILLPYAKFTGDLSPNPMQNLTRINPYMADTIFVKPTNLKQNIVVGLKGRFSSSIQYHVNGKYQKYENMHFFCPDSSSLLDNRFKVIYSDVELFNLYGELIIKILKDYKLKLKANYYNYSYLSNLTHAYYRPDYDITASASAQITPQLDLGMDAFIIGKRWAQSGITLDPIIDVNLNARYTFANGLGAFLGLNNILGKNYEIWYQYPVHGFQLMGGISYSF